MTIKYTDEQLAIFEHVKKGDQNLCIKAYAGSAKSTTILHCIPHTKPNEHCLFVAFNKTIAKEISNKLIEMNIPTTKATAKTLHSVGYSLVRSKFGHVQLDEHKYKNIYTNIVSKLIEEMKESRKYPEWILRKMEYTILSVPMLVNITKFMRYCLVEDVTIKNIQQLADHFSINEVFEFLDDITENKESYDKKHINPEELVLNVLSEGLELGCDFDNYPVIDFEDMIYIPVKFEIKSLSHPDWILIDECQDLNTCQVALVTNCIIGKSTRAISVGDPNQAIYGFSGARNDSFSYVKDQLAAKELTLSICFRCPKKHIEKAQQIVGGIKPYENAKDGTIATIDTAQMVEKASVGSYVLARKTATVVSIFFQFVAKRKPAVVLGRDFSKRIISQVKNINKKYEIQFFIKGVHSYFKPLIDALDKDQASKRIQLEDMKYCLEILWEEIQPVNYDGFIDEISKIFSHKDDEDTKSSVKNKVILSVVHRVKGLEANNIYIAEEIPLKWQGQQEWQYQQEKNLEYVALTRSKDALYFVQETKILPMIVEPPTIVVEESDGMEDKSFVDVPEAKEQDTMEVAREIYKQNRKEIEKHRGKFFVCNTISGKYEVVDKAWKYLSDQIDQGAKSDVLVTIKVGDL